MKLSLVLLISSVFCQVVLGKDPEEGIKRLTSEAKGNPTRENLMRLADEIKGNYYYEALLPPRVLAATNEARNELCKIPGHAQYFADEIERERKTVENLPPRVGERNSYDFHRDLYLRETLAHLPSPETVKILGHYLSDERDTPPPPRPDQDWSDYPANCLLASVALGYLGLRDAPVAKDIDWRNTDALAKNRAWWQEVKTGKKTFSFQGQKVEYRFKPDGTWDTIPIANPPDDVTKSSSSAQKRPEPRTNPAPPDSSQTTILRQWPWLAAIVAGACTCLVLLGLRAKRRNGQ